MLKRWKRPQVTVEADEPFLFLIMENRMFVEYAGVFN
jgi:hypothetical protein